MKIRKGFVSNSSSSSFIIAADRDISKHNLSGVCIQPVDFGNYIEESIRNYPDLHRYIMENYGWNKPAEIAVVLDEDEYALSTYLDMVSHLESGKTIHIGSVSNDSSDNISRSLYEYGISNSIKNENFEIISEEG